MEYEIKVPEAGFSITEATVVQWHKNVVERIQEGETIVSVETDKVVVEIPAQCTGVLIEIKHEVGETVPIGSVLGMIQGEGEEKVIPAGESRTLLVKFPKFFRISKLKLLKSVLPFKKLSSSRKTSSFKLKNCLS